MRNRAAVALVLWSSVALAQQTAPGFHEEVEVRVMDLDVVVTDRDGRSVPDLKREDFTVRVGGKVVPIDYFARIEEGVIHSPDLATASPDQILTAYREADEAYVPRHFLFYVDLGHLDPGGRRRGIEALKDLVTRMGPSDRGRVVVFDRRTKPLADWTSSKEELLAAVSRIEKVGVGMSRLMLERQTLHELDYPAAILGGQQEETRQKLVEHYAEQQRAEIRQLLSDVRAELPTFALLAGKKAFVFLSGGFEFKPGYAMGTYAATRPSGFNRPRNLLALRPNPFMGPYSVNVPNLSEEVQEVVKEANGSEITFYTLDARGLEVESTSAGGDEPLASRIGLVALADSQDGLVMLAKETGGLFLANANDLRPGLDQVYQDGAVYYSLGVTLAKIGSSGYQSVRVEVNRKGMTVRTRRGYAARTGEERRRDFVRAALRTNLVYSEIPLTLRTLPAARDGRHYLLPISVTLPSSGLTFLSEGGTRRAIVDVDLGVLEDSGRESEVVASEATFALPEGGPDGPLVYSTKLKIRGGNQRIVVNVRDRATGRMGTARANVHVE
jgi:VWFA-related protein